MMKNNRVGKNKTENQNHEKKNTKGKKFLMIMIITNIAPHNNNKNHYHHHNIDIRSSLSSFSVEKTEKQH